MTVKTVAQLNTADFDLKNITVTAVSFSEGDTSDYLESARTKHLFHLITHGSREYFLDNRHLTFRRERRCSFPKEPVTEPFPTSPTTAHAAVSAFVLI